jgi:LPXTG-motif cell wall-anchored protein
MALRLATMLVALALSVAAPSAALAQGAGDDQYSDPFGSGQNDDQGSGDEDAGAEPAPEPSQPAEPAPAPDPAPEATASQQQPAPQEQLPYTGADAGLMALAGGVLLASGLALRRRTSRPADRA